MSTAKHSVTSRGADQNVPLEQALNQNQELRHKVQQCAGELSSITSALEGAIATPLQSVGMEHVLDRSQEVESQVQECVELLSVVSNYLLQGIEERKKLARQLIKTEAERRRSHHLALHDSLTGLPNRALFNDRLKHALAQAQRESWAPVVMFIDLDNFKAINDSHGHRAGDSVLRTVAARLQACVRAVDTVSRQGGDEFLYLMSEVADENAIAAIAQKIIRTIHEPCMLADTQVRVRPSIGIAVYPKDGDTADLLLAHADAAMYVAKQNQTGFSFFSDSSVAGSDISHSAITARSGQPRINAHGYRAKRKVVTLEHKQRREVERRAEWRFLRADDGSWLWQVSRSDGTDIASRSDFPILEECLADAALHGFVEWKSAERRSRTRAA